MPALALSLRLPAMPCSCGRSRTPCQSCWDGEPACATPRVGGAVCGPLPTSPEQSSPTRSPSAAATDEPDDQQQDQRADCSVEDRRNDAGAEMDAELRQQPTANEGADDSNDDIPDDPKPGAS